MHIQKAEICEEPSPNSLSSPWKLIRKTSMDRAQADKLCPTVEVGMFKETRDEWLLGLHIRSREENFKWNANNLTMGKKSYLGKFPV